MARVGIGAEDVVTVVLVCEVLGVDEEEVDVNSIAVESTSEADSDSVSNVEAVVETGSPSEIVDISVPGGAVGVGVHASCRFPAGFPVSPSPHAYIGGCVVGVNLGGCGPEVQGWS